MNGSAPRILVVRPDRIGDVILSTPVLEAIKVRYPRSRVTFLVRDLVAPLVRGLPTVDEVLVYEPEGRHAGLSGVLALAREIRERRFDAALTLHAKTAVSAAIYLAGVPLRAGPYSKPHSFLLFNRGLRQRRSRALSHEGDYNLELATLLGASPGRVPTSIAVPESARSDASRWLAERGLERFVLVHPGMGGSALNWPESRYAELVSELAARGVRVLVTGGPAEGDLAVRVAARAGGAVLAAAGADAPSIDVFAALVERASVVVAPSTGPLHVAVALGRPVVTFFPTVRVQSARRWGPYVVDGRYDKSRAAVLEPAVSCRESYRCRGPSCPEFPCMEKIPVSLAREEVMKRYG